jgi:hypothetical protein
VAAREVGVPRYRFRIFGGDRDHPLTIDLPDDEAAKNTVKRLLDDQIFSQPSHVLRTTPLAVSVENEGGEVLASLLAGATSNPTA